MKLFLFLFLSKLYQVNTQVHRQGNFKFTSRIEYQFHIQPHLTSTAYVQLKPLLQTKRKSRRETIQRIEKAKTGYPFFTTKLVHFLGRLLLHSVLFSIHSYRSIHPPALEIETTYPDKTRIPIPNYPNPSVSQLPNQPFTCPFLLAPPRASPHHVPHISSIPPPLTPHHHPPQPSTIHQPPPAQAQKSECPTCSNHMQHDINE